MNTRQRALLAEKLADTGNLAAGALIFGQLLGDRFSITIGIAGVAFWALLTASSIQLLHRRRK